MADVTLLQPVVNFAFKAAAFDWAQEGLNQLITARQYIIICCFLILWLKFLWNEWETFNLAQLELLCITFLKNITLKVQILKGLTAKTVSSIYLKFDPLVWLNVLNNKKKKLLDHKSMSFQIVRLFEFVLNNS